MLVAAREMDCQHIWNAHAASARGAGVPDALVDALRDKQPLPAMAPDEAAVVYLGEEFFRTHKVSRGAFQTALEQFGQQGVVELAADCDRCARHAHANDDSFDWRFKPKIKPLPRASASVRRDPGYHGVDGD